MQALAIMVSLAMLTGFMGWWGLGIIFCAVTIPLLVVILPSAIS
jgi:hypothetical protein